MISELNNGDEAEFKTFNDRLNQIYNDCYHISQKMDLGLADRKIEPISYPDRSNKKYKREIKEILEQMGIDNIQVGKHQSLNCDFYLPDQ